MRDAVICEPLPVQGPMGPRCRWIYLDADITGHLA
jgi:hypothetical protein